MTATSEKEIVLSRVFDAPRALVWKAWTDPKHVALWWGPKGFTTTTSEMNVRVGGSRTFVMHAPDGTDFPNHIVYTAVEPGALLAWEHGTGDGKVLFRTTVTFEDEGGKTRLTLRNIFDTVEACTKAKTYAVEGGNSTMQCLAEYLPTMNEADHLVITRTFDAPIAQVWAAWTETERLAKWWGPKGFELLNAKFELRPGGAYHYSMKAPNGQVMWGRFDYLEVAAPSRLVFVNGFSDENGAYTRHPAAETWPLKVLNRLTLEAAGGKTTLTIRGIPLGATEAELKTFQGAHSNLQKGFVGTFEQLDAYLAAG